MTAPEGVEIGVFVYGSLEAGVGWGSGEARVVSDCGQKNEVLSKRAKRVSRSIDVNVNSRGVLDIYGQNGANNRS